MSKEIGAVGRVLTWKSYLSDQVIVIYAILNQDIALGLKPLLLTHFSLYQMYLSNQSSVLVVILNQVMQQQAWSQLSPSRPFHL